ncbi:MAG: hypothetical protein RMK74_10100 [Myxococcales bacterium]|nr:hypothetical protein [Myxococcales bacterium]
MRRVVVAPVDDAGRDDRERRAAPHHLPHLNGRSVGAEHESIGLAAAHEEAVVHVGRRMIRRETETVEVVLGPIHLRPVGDVEAHRGEHVDDVEQRPARRVQPAGARPAARQRRIDRRDIERAPPLALAKLRQRLLEGVLDPLA